MPSSTPRRSQYTALPTRSNSEDGALPTLSSAASETGNSRTDQRKSALALEVDTLFRRWTSTIAEKMKKNKRRKGKEKRNLVEERDRDKIVEIMASVFEVYEADGKGKGKGKEKAVPDDDEDNEEGVMTLDHEPPMTLSTFSSLVDRVRSAIEAGVQPRLNSKGSSGSYFARDGEGTTVGIFKPKDEEPYGRLNPKLTKWLHRNFFSRIIPFGRACLIPQLSYLSESSASLLDRRLGTHIVPRTEVVALSSRAFFYDWIDIERAGRKGRLPEKDGSFQVFLKGFQDASVFLRDHPYPGRPLSQTLDTSTGRARRRHGGVSLFGPLRCLCGRAMAEDDDEEYDEEGDEGNGATEREEQHTFRWTEELMDSFREQLEQLVVLDYLIRNTDRGLDNFMMKPCLCTTPPGTSTTATPPSALFTSPPAPQPRMSELNARPLPPLPAPSNQHAPSRPHIHIAAIDNSLAFPHAHPAGWRSFTYGWLYLPAALIGQPFSGRTREKFLPLLTNPGWWEETTLQLRREFAKDHEFKEKMFRKQMSVMKGQAFNLVQSLLDEEEGPIELCRRPKKLVWDDFIEVADDDMTRSLIAATHAPPSTVIVDATNALAGHDDLLVVEREPPLPSLPMPTSPPTARRPLPSRSSYGHARSGSATVSSVLSSHAFPEAVTGVEVVKTLDKADKEERRRGGSVEPSLPVGVEEEEDDSSGDEAEPSWGVQSEGDVLHSRSPGMPSISSVSTQSQFRRGSSFESPRAPAGDLSASDTLDSRSRSGSLQGEAPSGRRPQYGRSAYTSRHVHSVSIDTPRRGGREGSWIRAFSGERVEEVDETEEEVQRKVVVVERLEELKDEPRFAGLSTCF